MDKVCTKCNVEQDEILFGWRKRGVSRHEQCKSCKAKHNKSYYKRHSAKLKVESRKRRLERQNHNQEALYRYLLAHPCIECGESEPILLEFDHLGDKSNGIANMIAHQSWDTIELEISKCQVLCVVCHRFKTARETNNFKYQKYLERTSLS